MPLDQQAALEATRAVASIPRDEDGPVYQLRRQAGAGTR